MCITITLTIKCEILYVVCYTGSHRIDCAYVNFIELNSLKGTDEGILQLVVIVSGLCPSSYVVQIDHCVSGAESAHSETISIGRMIL
jgi:hypothetical protein